MANRLAKAETAEPIAKDQRGVFDRAPDPTRLKVNSAKLVGKVALQEAIVGVCDRNGFDPKSMAVVGPALGRRFFVQFNGAGQIPVENAERFLASLKNDDDEWG